MLTSSAWATGKREVTKELTELKSDSSLVETGVVIAEAMLDSCGWRVVMVMRWL